MTSAIFIRNHTFLNNGQCRHRSSFIIILCVPASLFHIRSLLTHQRFSFILLGWYIFFRFLPQWGLRPTLANVRFLWVVKPMIAHNHAVQMNWLGDRVTLLPLCVVSCSQRSVLETNHLPLRHIQVTAFAVSSFLIHRIIFLQASCDFACCIACLWSRLLGCKFCWRQLGWQTQCDDNALW